MFCLLAYNIPVILSRVNSQFQAILLSLLQGYNLDSIADCSKILIMNNTLTVTVDWTAAKSDARAILENLQNSKRIASASASASATLASDKIASASASGLTITVNRSQSKRDAAEIVARIKALVK